MSDAITEKGTGQRGRWRFKNGTFEPVTKETKLVNAPFIQPDTIPPTESMATANREIFDSKSRLMEHYKKHGYECTWGERPKGPKGYKPDKEQIANDWREAERLAKWGMVPLSEKEKQRCIEEERAYEAWKKRQ